MNLTREQILAEMGITPIWRLRPSQRKEAPVQEEMPPAPVVAEPDPVPAPALEPEPAPQSDFHLEPDLPTEMMIPDYPEDFGDLPDMPPGEYESLSREEYIARLDWDGLKTTTAACRACGLCSQRKQAVLGVGDVQADWLFIGEGPGADEDAQGEPFVGQAGKLLDNMLAAIDLKRGNKVYIANAVKCRPPGNRTPTAEEMAACRPYLERQIQLIKPRLIVLLGKAAVSTMLHKDDSLAALRGKPFDYQGIPVVVTYHPAYLLRSLPEKAKAWEDLVFARRLMRKSGV